MPKKIRELIRALEKAGWTVSEAENGREALEVMSQAEPQLILLDLMMPVMDGFEFVLELRKNESCREIPVIVLTAKDLTEDDRRRLNGDVERIVSKAGLSQDRLLEQIRGLVGQHSDAD